ncbi:MAG: hypothetical protein U9R74_07190 [Pseudomonadota bacterium]|nr:hypothetical protein [Pseudomonadota bacterium]
MKNLDKQRIVEATDALKRQLGDRLGRQVVNLADLVADWNIDVRKRRAIENLAVCLGRIQEKDTVSKADTRRFAKAHRAVVQKFGLLDATSSSGRSLSAWEEESAYWRYMTRIAIYAGILTGAVAVLAAIPLAHSSNDPWIEVIFAAARAIFYSTVFVYCMALAIRVVVAIIRVAASVVGLKTPGVLPLTKTLFWFALSAGIVLGIAVGPAIELLLILSFLGYSLYAIRRSRHPCMNGTLVVAPVAESTLEWDKGEDDEEDYFFDDSSLSVNPASGLPMVDKFFDSAGNAFGTNDTD